MRWLWLFLFLLGGCAAPPDHRGILMTAGDWDMPPAYHGNPWAPGGVGVARSYVYEPLFDYIPAEKRFLPRLAESFEEKPDSLTVHLRGDVVWHDGEPFTARDVESTFQIGFLKGMEIWWYLDRIETPDPKTVIFRWKRRSPTNTLLALTEPVTTGEHLFRQYLPRIRALDRSHPAAGQKLEQEVREVLFAERPPLPVGTGPFRLAKVTASDMLLERFERYYRPVHLKGVRIARWGRNEVVWSYLYAGQLDAVSPACPYDLARETLRRNPAIHMLTPSDLNEMGLVLNCRRPPFDDLSFRQAVSCSLDRDAIRQLACAPGDTAPGAALGMVPSLADQWLGPGFAAKLPAYGYDPERARGYLHQKPARTLEIIAPAGFTDLALLAEAAASQMTKFGIPCAVRLVQGDLYESFLRDGEFDLAAVFGSQMGRTVHPATSYGRFLAGDAQLTRASGLPPEQDLVDRLRVATSPSEARELTRRMATLVSERVSFIPCFEKRLTIFVQEGPRVHGWPPASSPLWSAAPLGVENLYCSMAAQGLLH